MIEYRVIGDGCGTLIASSTIGVRAARTEAQMNYGANKGLDGDHCIDCRKNPSTLSQEDMARAAARRHSTVHSKQ